MLYFIYFLPFMVNKDYHIDAICLVLNTNCMQYDVFFTCNLKFIDIC